MEELKSLGVGQIFTSGKINIGDGIFVSRVNAFHPSYAMFHNPAIGCLRQLLPLEVAHTCGVLRGDSNEEEWVSGFRSQCRASNKKVSKTADQGFKTELDCVDQVSETS